MPKGKRLSAPAVPGWVDPDERTSEQELEAIGAITPKTVENIKWAKPFSKRKGSDLLTLTKSGIYFPDFVGQDAGERIAIGVGTFEGKKCF